MHSLEMVTKIRERNPASRTRFAVYVLATWSLVTRPLDVPVEKEFVEQIYRIGEASNPGPYMVGGASSSAANQPLEPEVSRTAGVPTAGKLPDLGGSSCPAPVGVGMLSSAERSGAREPSVSGEGAVHEAVGAKVCGALTSRFDDVDDWGFGEPEELDSEQYGAEEPWLTVTERPNAALRETREHKFVALDVDIELSDRRESNRRPSAMVEWEACPAIIEGVVGLPTIAEDEGGFRTAEGWWVSDPLEQKRRSHARLREQRLGIAGLYGSSSSGPECGRLPPKKPCPNRSAQQTGRQRLAELPREALPLEPQVEEQASDPVSGGIAQAMGDDVVKSVDTADTDEGCSCRGGRRRRRGKGRRGAAKPEEDTVSLWTFNSSGAPQLRAAINHCCKSSGDVPVAILCQEHHAGAEQLPDLQAQIRAVGWKLAATKANITLKGSRSAGVGVCTPSWVAAGVEEGNTVDCSPVESPGRIAALWLQQVAPGGILIVSCYLHVGEASSSRNIELLSHALRTARTSGCPWVIGLDAQQEPNDLLSWAATMVDRAEGTVIAPCEPTHFPGVGQCKRLDFFILDRSLAEAVQGVETVAEFRCVSRDSDYTVAAKPHRAATLKLNRKYRPMLLRTLKQPRAFPRNKPIGCARRPVTTCTPATESLQVAGDRASNLAAITEAWGRVVRDVEEELCGVCDLTGKARQVYGGRENEAKEVLRPSLPRRAAGRRGAMAQTDYVAVWGANRLKELLALSELYSKSGGHSPGQERQWVNLVRKFCSPSAPTTGSGDQRWEETAKTLQRCWSKPAEAATALRSTCNWAEALTRKQAKSRAEKQRESWERWKKKQANAGGQGGALFCFMKRIEEDPEVVLRCSSGASASPQAILDRDFLCWNSLWQKLSQHASAQWRQECSIDERSCSLPPLGSAELRKAARTFKASTAAGVDAVLPTQYAWLSDELLNNIGKLLGVIEDSGCWPRQTMLSIIHLIPKQSGGKRPIGLLASIVRLWDRARKPITDDWRSTCEREYDWMRKGRGAERSVWAQALHEEAAAARGLATASVFIDLVKAFEQVVLGRVWSSGLKHGMQRPILRLAVEACAFTRRLKYKGAISEAASTLTAILAGSGRATDLLLVTLIDAVDEALLQHERMQTNTALRCFMIVDDIRFAVQGREDEVADVLPRLADTVVKILESDLHMEVSRDSAGLEGKTVVQTSSRELDLRMRRPMSKLGVKVKERVKNLGVHFVARSRKGTNVEAVKRYKVALKRVQRAQRVGKKAHLQAFRSLLVPSFTFGASAVSCPSSIIKKLRTQTARAFGPIEGRSTTARLLLESSDVRQAVTLKTVMAWVSALWEELVELEVMQLAWKHACACRSTDAGKSTGALAGAAAYLAALQQIGWQSPSVHSVRTRHGHILYFGRGPAPEGAHSVDPAFIKVIASDEYESSVLANSKLAEDIADLSGMHGYPRDDSHARAVDADNQEDHQRGERDLEEEARVVAIWRRGRFEHSENGPIPWLWPSKAVMRAARRHGLQKEAASVRALVEGGWPTQFKLFCQRQAEHMMCSCGAAVGTLRHKLSECSLTEELRQRVCPEWLLKSARRGGFDPLFTRGVPARPKPPGVPCKLEWSESVDGEPIHLATGDIYTDGSSKGQHWRARRGGWAVVALDGAGRWQWTKWGALGGLNISSFRAELQALLEALKIAVPPVRIHTDNQNVVDGVLRGKLWCTRAKATGADLWRSVFDKLEELKDEGEVAVVKVKAHTGWFDLISRRIAPRDQFGNWLTDEAPKAATAASEIDAPTARFNAQLKTALAWTRWTARYAASWVRDIAPSQRLAPSTSSDMAWVYGDAHLRHEKWTVGQRAVCRRCGIAMPAKEGAARISLQCAGAATGRAAARATGNINFVWARFLYSKRQLVERGGKLIEAAPPPRWIVDLQRLDEVFTDRSQVVRTAVHPGERSWLPSDFAAQATPVWLRKPEWMPAHLVQPWEEGESLPSHLHGCRREELEARDDEHRVVFAGPIAYCSKCACFTQKRLGSRFKNACVLPAGRAAAAVAYRLTRLRAGKHPVTGHALQEEEYF